MFKRIRHPELYQGVHKKTNYFEGWYYKLVSKTHDVTLALIPGISLNKKDPHAFIQVFISQKNQGEHTLTTRYFRYAISAFIPQEQPFSIAIDQNFFSKEKIELHLNDHDIKLNGVIMLHHLTPLKTSLYAPNIMGPFAYLNFMECYHGVVSMNHMLSGSVTLNQKTIDFHQGKGYIEKDWGKSFPRAYVWLQSNHFSDASTSFMFSYADIPFGKRYFKGLIVNVVIGQKEYRFATYNRAKVIREDIQNNRVHYQIKKGKYMLDIKAHSMIETSLASPKNGEMINQIKEGLSGEVAITLYQGKDVLYEDTGYHAGIEIMKAYNHQKPV